MNEYIEFETLNAYVDGELDAARAADVALAVAGDPALARQVAILSRMRSVLIETVEKPDINLGISKRSENRYRRPLIAACIALLMFAASALAVTGFYNQGSAPQWFVAVADAHNNWPEEKRAIDDLAKPAGLPGPGIFNGAFIPELEAAKLYISHIAESVGPAGAKLITVRYRGTRGCRITLYISTDVLAFPPEKTLFKQERQQAYAWRSGKYGYGVIAEGMDISRYQLIVETMYQAIKRYQPIDPETRVALGESRRRSVPCLA